MKLAVHALLSTVPSCQFKKHTVFNGNLSDNCQFDCDNHLNTDNKEAKYRYGKIGHENNT